MDRDIERDTDNRLTSDLQITLMSFELVAGS